MSEKLKRSVQGYIESKQLSQEQFEQLDKLVNRVENKPTRARWFNFNIAAVIFVFALVPSLYWMVSNNQKVDVVELIAEEVAYNHLKMKPMEVSSTSLGDLRAYFSKLDFSLSHSKYVAERKLKLIGGRYCSIQGNAAAQLRMQNEETGDIQIVYQAPYDKDVFRELPKLHEGQSPVRHFVNGVAVDIWVENGLLYARSFNQ